MLFYFGLTFLYYQYTTSKSLNNNVNNCQGYFPQCGWVYHIIFKGQIWMSKIIEQKEVMSINVTTGI